MATRPFHHSNPAATRSRALSALAVGLSLAVEATSATAAAIDVEIRRENADVVVDASVQLPTDADTAWHVLTDYERYVDFIPGLRSSEVVAREGSRATVVQSGSAMFGLVRLPLDIRYEITETPPYRVDSTATATAPLRALESRYVLTPTPRGVRLDYAGRVGLRPSLLNGLEGFVVEHNIVLDFQALADEIERRAKH